MMKKLILMMFAAMFLCNNSYGASISELLKGGKSIKLICTIEKGGMGFLHPEYKYKDVPERTGGKYFLEIKNDAFTITGGNFGEDEYLYYTGKKEFTGNNFVTISEGSIEISEKNILLNYIAYRPKKRGDPLTNIEYEVNRFTGVFNLTYHSTSGGFIAFDDGTCEKVTDKKF